MSEFKQDPLRTNAEYALRKAVKKSVRVRSCLAGLGLVSGLIGGNGLANDNDVLAATSLPLLAGVTASAMANRRSTRRELRSVIKAYSFARYVQTAEKNTPEMITYGEVVNGELVTQKRTDYLASQALADANPKRIEIISTPAVLSAGAALLAMTSEGVIADNVAPYANIGAGIAITAGVAMHLSANHGAQRQLGVHTRQLDNVDNINFIMQ